MTDPPPLQQPNYFGPDSGGAPLPPSGLAVASMVCGTVSLPLFCIWYVSVPLALVAVILGLIARSRVRRGIAGGGGMALAGVICGAVTRGTIQVMVAGVAVLAAVVSSANRPNGGGLRHH